MTPEYFTRDIKSLAGTLNKLAVDESDVDEILSTDFVEILINPEIVFSVFPEEQVGIHYELENSAQKVEQISEKCWAFTVDDIQLVVVNVIEYLFLFVRRRELEAAEALISGLL